MVSISSLVKGLVALYFVVSGGLMFGTYGDCHRNATLTDNFATKLGLSVQSTVTKLELVGLFITILSGLQIWGAIAFQLGRLEGAHLLVCYMLLSPAFLPEFQHQYPLVPRFLVLHRGSLQLMAGLLVVLLFYIEARDMKAMTRPNRMIRPQNQNTTTEIITTENQNQNPTPPAVNENPTANQNSTIPPTGNQNQNPTLPAVNENPTANQNSTTPPTGNQNQNPTPPALNANPTANQNSTTPPTGSQNQNPTPLAVNENPTANQNSTTPPTGNQNPPPPAVNQNPNNRGWGILQDLACLAVALCFVLMPQEERLLKCMRS